MTYFSFFVAVFFTSFLFYPTDILRKTQPVICNVCEPFRLKEDIA